MEARLQQVIDCISSIEDVSITSPFIDDKGLITGQVLLASHGSNLAFDVTIGSQYPFQFHGTETIRFVNMNLIECDHVNSDGSICVHTLHSPDLIKKLQFDFGSLKEWIAKYFITREKDSHYEHIVVPYSEFNDTTPVFLFTDIAESFVKGEHGFLRYSFMTEGNHNQKKTITYLIQDFQRKKNSVSACDWSDYYKALSTSLGLYVFIQDAPVKNRRFAVDSWQDLESYVAQDFLLFLHNSQASFKKAPLSDPIPLFIGYNISDNEIHWQCVIITADNFPNYGQKVQGYGNYIGRFKNEPISWVETKNCSYKYFFGRGALNKKLTEGKVLILGVGAIGSMVATTLARGGCRHISLVDFDRKEPENVCRAEYFFGSGLQAKTNDLGKSLLEISPFVRIIPYEHFTDGIKLYINSKRFDDAMQERLSEYDYIIDCTTDDDLAFILDSLEPKATVINLSITNHARELVCAVSPDVYTRMNIIYGNIQQDKVDLYNPVGCWSPTFKASYNDISVMVQHAIRRINICLERDEQLRSFYLQYESDEVTLKTNLF